MLRTIPKWQCFQILRVKISMDASMGQPKCKCIARNKERNQRMIINVYQDAFSICKVPDPSVIDLSQEMVFVGKTKSEISYICKSDLISFPCLGREDGFRVLGIEGTLDFSLVGILSRIATILAEQQISIVAVSTFDTDYILVRNERLEDAINALRLADYQVEVLKV